MHCLAEELQVVRGAEVLRQRSCVALCQVLLKELMQQEGVWITNITRKATNTAVAGSREGIPRLPNRAQAQAILMNSVMY
jgi:hypothetical protein